MSPEPLGHSAKSKNFHAAKPIAGGENHQTTFVEPQPGRFEADGWAMPFAEYAVVLGLCSLVVGLALYELGVPLLEAYHVKNLFILLPFP